MPAPPLDKVLRALFVYALLLAFTVTPSAAMPSFPPIPANQPAPPNIVSVIITSSQTQFNAGQPTIIHLALVNNMAREIYVQPEWAINTIRLFIRDNAGRLVDHGPDNFGGHLTPVFVPIAAGGTLSLTTPNPTPTRDLDLSMWGYRLSPGTYTIQASSNIGIRLLDSNRNTTAAYKTDPARIISNTLTITVVP
jgi:hypothetical protein